MSTLTATVVIPNGICITTIFKFLGPTHGHFPLKSNNVYAFAVTPMINNRNVDTSMGVKLYIAYKVCSYFNAKGVNTCMWL